MSELEELIRSLAEPVLARHGAELIDLEVKRGRTQLVRVVADTPKGIDLETCARVSGELSRMLDVEDPIQGTYTLEVTSPGLDRPLRTPEDFRRNRGRRVRLVLEDRQHEGVIEEVGEESVTISDGDEPVRIELAQIAKAKLILPW